ncbi:two-component system response regulator [Burkholderia mayonis]|uniref:Two-component system response regulator n=2 Tax=Burkholderia mayonis TaxID=1385591 RepID=A0A1B4G7J4_9BURK|nr:two-component system response regulator [Burkholderia mayonis]KVE58705.1 two-component system response regulator [Burkholderia mayonis]
MLIAEDQLLLRRGLRRMISELRDYRVDGEASDGLEACRIAIATLPDLVLMDLSMPCKSGFEAIAAIKTRAPWIRIVVLTVHHSDEHVREALAAGADGYVTKDASFEDLVVEMRVVMQGARGESPSACRGPSVAPNPFPGTPKQAQMFDSLTSRERTVMRLVVEGNTNRQIGEHLQLSSKTVEKHRASLMRKLGAANLTALVRAAIDMGVLTLPG